MNICLNIGKNLTQKNRTLASPSSLSAVKAYDSGFVNFATASSNSKVASPVGFIPLYLENSISVSLPQVGQIFVDDLFVNVSSCSKHSLEMRMLNCLFKGASPPSL